MRVAHAQVWLHNECLDNDLSIRAGIAEIINLCTRHYLHICSKPFLNNSLFYAAQAISSLIQITKNLQTIPKSNNSLQGMLA